MFALEPRMRKTSVISNMTDVDNVSVFSGDGEQKKSEYVDGNLKLISTPECTREVMCVRFNHDGSLVAAGQADGTIKIFQTESGQNVHTLVDDDIKKQCLPVTSIKFKPSIATDKVEHTHLLIASYASGLVKYWHYTSGNCLTTIKEQKPPLDNTDRQTLSLAISPKADSFLTCGADPQINHYDIETKKLLNAFEPSDSRDQMDGHRFRVFAIKFHPFHNNLFLSGGWDDTVQFWDTREKHAVKRLYGPHICGDALDIDGTHNHILTGSWRKDNPLQIWDFRSADLIKNVPQDGLHGSLLYSCQWLGKENILCGGCDQNMARIIDRGTLNTVGQLAYLPQGVFCIDNDRQPVKPRIAVGAASKVYILKMDKKAT